MTAVLTLGAVLLSQHGCVENSFFDDDDQVVDRLRVDEAFEQAPLPEVDILWIVDDTASMAEEQAALAEGFAAFLASLESAELAYQVGVITTDADDAVLRGDPWIITPEADDPVDAFERAVDVGLTGTAQAGLASMIAALSEPLRSGENRGFQRSDAALLAVVVSDDDDASGAWVDGDPVTVALALLADQAQARGLPARLSAIVGDAPSGCSGVSGVALPGSAYAAVAQASGGEVLSICDADLEGLVGSLGGLAAAWPDTFLLQAEPLADSVQVTVDGKRTDSGWRLQLAPAAIVFDAPPDPGAWIVVSYELAGAGTEG